MPKRYIELSSDLDTAEVFDDSNGQWQTTGLVATANYEFGWQYLLCNEYNIFPFNRAQGSTGYFTSINNAYQHVLNPTPELMLMRSGYNEVRTFLTDPKGLEYAKSCIRGMLCVQYAATGLKPASDAAVTKTGTWTAESIATSKANRLGGTPMKSSTIGDIISWTFTGTNCIVGIRNSDGIAATYGSVKARIDGSPATITGNMSSENFDEYSMNNKAYNAAGSGGFIFGAFQIKGLSDTSHTIELELLENQTTIIDWFAQLMLPANCAPAIICDVVHDNTGTVGRNTAIDNLNSVMHQMLEDEFIEYLEAHVLAYAFLNNFVNPINTVDNIHFDLTGHKEIAVGVQDVINTV